MSHPPEPPCPPPPPCGPFKWEAVVTCVNYSDFLAWTLRDNRSLFDRLVVVTAPEDRKTRRVCEYLHVECIPTDCFRTRWNEFCKGCAINEGLSRLDMDGWVVHMDADIALPPLSRRLIAKANLDKCFLYGADRVNVPCFEDWADFCTHPRLQHEDECWLHMNQFPMGTRVAIHGYDGYIPIGFFQLWNPKASGVMKYPEGHTSAAREDTAFALQWPRNRRALLPEILCYHLESERADKGANWNGRTTKPFGPTK